MSTITRTLRNLRKVGIKVCIYLLLGYAMSYRNKEQSRVMLTKYFVITGCLETNAGMANSIIHNPTWPFRTFETNRILDHELTAAPPPSVHRYGTCTLCWRREGYYEEPTKGTKGLTTCRRYQGWYLGRHRPFRQQVFRERRGAATYVPSRVSHQGDNLLTGVSVRTRWIEYKAKDVDAYVRRIRAIWKGR